LQLVREQALLARAAITPAAASMVSAMVLGGMARRVVFQ